MKKSTAALLSFCCFLMGVIVGFLLSPIKDGVHCGNNNGNTTVYNSRKDESETEE